MQGNKRITEPLLLVLAALSLLLALLLPPAVALGLTDEEAALLAAYERDELIRLHILADDDSAEAQALKLRVRDAVLEAYGDCLEQADDFASAWSALSKNADGICAVAQDVAGELPVSAEVGLLTLPAKRYGDVLLPAGTYHGLRIVIGQGAGRNWWCVLFPQLCLAVASDEPWQLPSPESPLWEETVTWQTERIFSQWLCAF